MIFTRFGGFSNLIISILFTTNLMPLQVIHRAVSFITLRIKNLLWNQ